MYKIFRGADWFIELIGRESSANFFTGILLQVKNYFLRVPLRKVHNCFGTQITMAALVFMRHRIPIFMAWLGYGNDIWHQVFFV